MTNDGDDLELVLSGALGRDVALVEAMMITLPQGDLPEDSGILRTAAQHNGVNVGVYASVVIGGTIRRRDPVVLG